ncbi:hypothetical protein MON38_13390 [Hymenobacter sp. DH14]|uniref:Outer membrane protein beta-barrel domain-containing protein n=1 Tax=Hymenobacter cyanobacteriorum TaxID=2926463 RepID=A0A9X1VHT5_9BACT|nr:hypothetical protein [Hymenobacter cyanobacteriorum]MCI1188418.1 hypothetical protein [Hymenobacter cyanobacteriorum]
MKKTFLSLFLAAGVQLAQAQSIPAGTVSLGGSVGYSRSTSNNSGTSNGTTYTNETTTSQFSLAPSVGYFVADNLAIGLTFSYQAFSKPYITYTPAPSVVRAQLDPTTTLRLGAYGQYYKMLTEQFGFLGTLGGGYQSMRDYAYTGNSSSALISEFKASGYYAELTPGIVFFPIPKLGLTASIGSLAFNHLNYDYPTNSGTAPSGYESKSSTFGASFGLSQLQFGGTYYFGR